MRWEDPVRCGTAYPGPGPNSTTKRKLTAQNVALEECGVAGVDTGPVGRMIVPNGPGGFGATEHPGQHERKELAGRLRRRPGGRTFRQRNIGPLGAARAFRRRRRLRALGRVRRVMVCGSGTAGLRRFQATVFVCRRKVRSERCIGRRVPQRRQEPARLAATVGRTEHECHDQPDMNERPRHDFQLRNDLGLIASRTRPKATSIIFDAWRPKNIHGPRETAPNDPIRTCLAHCAQCHSYHRGCRYRSVVYSGSRAVPNELEPGRHNRAPLSQGCSDP